MEDVSNPLHNMRRDVLCSVFEDISNFIESPLSTTGQKVNIWVRDIGQLTGENPGTSLALGLASPFFVLPPPNTSISGILDNQMFITINSGMDAYIDVAPPMLAGGNNSPVTGLFFHGQMAFNFANPLFANNWYYGTNQTITSDKKDFYSVALHEVFHLLGFISLIDFDGASKFGVNYPYYSRYDMFLKTQGGDQLITNGGATCSLYQFQFNSGLTAEDILSPNPATCGGVNNIPHAGSLDYTNCSQAVSYVSGNVNQKVYTPDCFERPSSLSHFEDQCQVPLNFNLQPPASNNKYFVMSNASGSGNDYVKRYPTIEERIVLCDLGYSVKDTYGHSAFTVSQVHNYTYACSGIDVIGINDGIDSATTAYQYFVPNGVSTNSIVPASNDYNAVGFSCLELILGSGTIYNLSPAPPATVHSTFRYTPSSPGLHLFRYIPVSSTGRRGNITYIYLYSYDRVCTPSVCDLVLNGSMEETTPECGDLSGPTILACWENLASSPDLLSYDCFGGGLGLPTVGSYPALPAGTGTFNNGQAGNIHVVGGACGGVNNHEETMQTLLSSPMYPGTYKLSFWAIAGRNNIATTRPMILEFYGSTVSAWTSQIYGFTPTQYDTLLHAQELPISAGNGEWTYYEAEINYPEGEPPLHRLIVAPNVNEPLPTSSLKSFFFDAVSLMPINYAPSIAIADTLCFNQIVNVDVVPPGGTLTGAGVTCDTNGCVFNAALAGVGEHLLTYEYSSPVTSCQGTSYATVTVMDRNLQASVALNEENPCPLSSSGQATVSVSDTSLSYTYEWNSSPPQYTSTASGLSTGQYTVTITNSLGCTTQETVVVTTSSDLGVSTNTLNNTCVWEQTGQVVALPTGGQQPYTYAWNTQPQQITATASNLEVGNYNVTVTDNAGCYVTAAAAVGEDVCLNANTIDEIAYLSVYPNPNNGNMYLEYRGLNETSLFEMHDVMGRKVFSIALQKGENKLNVSLHETISGVYFYRVSNGQSTSNTGKIIIQK